MPVSQFPNDDRTQDAQPVEIDVSRQVKLSLISGIFIVCIFLIASMLVAIGPILPLGMPANEYAVWVGTLALICLDSVAFGWAYFVLRVGNPARHAVMYLSVVMLLLIIATSWPADGFINRLFFGGLATLFGS